MKLGITEKQKNARIRNFSKGRIKGCLVTLRYVAYIDGISEEVRNYLLDASQLVNNAITDWEKR